MILRFSIFELRVDFRDSIFDLRGVIGRASQVSSKVDYRFRYSRWSSLLVGKFEGRKSRSEPKFEIEADPETRSSNFVPRSSKFENRTHRRPRRANAAQTAMSPDLLRSAASCASRNASAGGT